MIPWEGMTRNSASKGANGNWSSKATGALSSIPANACWLAPELATSLEVAIGLPTEIVVDFVNAISSGQQLVLRNPHATPSLANMF